MRAWEYGPAARFVMDPDSRHIHPVRAKPWDPYPDPLCSEDGPQQLVTLPGLDHAVCVDCLRALLWFPPHL